MKSARRYIAIGVLWILRCSVIYCFPEFDVNWYNTGHEIESQQSHQVVIGRIVLSGNAVTKERVIYNELLFAVNDSINIQELGDLISRSRENLLNTSLFNFVSIEVTNRSGNVKNIAVEVQERWYWWVFPIFEHADRNLSAFVDNGDWSRVNYGVYLKKENFRGRKGVLKFKLRTGYKNHVELLFDSPGYKKRAGWALGMDYVVYNQVPYATVGNQAIYYHEFNGAAQTYLNSSVFFKYRFNHYTRHSLGISYKSYSVRDTVVVLNPNYLSPGNSSTKFAQIQYSYAIDQRDSKVFPLNGLLLKLILTQNGLGLWDSDFENSSASLRLAKYYSIYGRLSGGLEVYGEVNSGSKMPYVLSPGLGFDEFLNGFEYNVIDGTSLAFTKNHLLFELVPTKVKKLDFVPLSQFSKIHFSIYLRAFFDFGYVRKEFVKEGDTMSNSLLFGYGGGVDLVTYYDKVLSLNYSLNRFGFRGFVIHWNLTL